MKINLSAKVVVAILLSGLFLNTALAAFSDLPSTNKYYLAVEYLKTTGAIGGYPDGTFKPDKNVSRAEFLKLLFSALQISADGNAFTGFNDVDENAWYAKYVQTAKAKDWIQGYADNSFRPERSVNKAEALKIIAMSLDWDTSSLEGIASPFIDIPATAWYAPFISYAKQKNFIEESGRYYIPDAMLNRGQISEILFRIRLAKDNKTDSFKISLIKYAQNIVAAANSDTPPTDTTTTVGNPTQELAYLKSLNSTEIGKSTFEGVTLKENMPSIFFLNEVYIIEGTTSSSLTKDVFAFLAPEKEVDNNNYTDYVGKITDRSFKIQIHFDKPGKFKLGIIPGKSGQSKVVDITVAPYISSINPVTDTTLVAPKPVFKNDMTTFNTGNTAGNISRLVFEQGSTVKFFILRQNVQSFDVIYKALQGLKQGPVNIRLERIGLTNNDPLNPAGNWKKSAVNKVNAIAHGFNEQEPDSLTISRLPETLDTIRAIGFDGTTSIKISVDAYIIKPDGLVDSVKLKSTGISGESIAAGSDFSFSYTPSTTGAYSIEINNTDGLAMLNTTVYVGTGIPLIPNFFDIHRDDDTTENYDLTTYRTKLLKLVNDERIKVGLSPVVADTALDKLAQAHSTDMATRNYFGHVDPDGKTPDIRRKAAGIPTPVGENLSNAPTLLFSHNGLMQSAIHRNNILNPYWTRVGIGMTRDKDNNILTTEEFSYDPLNATTATVFKENVIISLNKKRADLGIGELSLDSRLNDLADSWSEKMIEQNFFDFSSPDGKTLSSIITASGLNRTVQALILESNNRERLASEIDESEETVNRRWNRIGIGIKADDTGLMRATILFSN